MINNNFEKIQKVIDEQTDKKLVGLNKVRSIQKIIYLASEELELTTLPMLSDSSNKVGK